MFFYLGGCRDEVKVVNGLELLGDHLFGVEGVG